jgi:hypothetical protein
MGKFPLEDSQFKFFSSDSQTISARRSARREEFTKPGRNGKLKRMIAKLTVFKEVHNSRDANA